MARRIMSKDCNRGQSAMWRRVGNRSSIWRSIHWNQCETEPRGEGERNRWNQSHTESRMRENCTYGSMRGRAYPTTRGVPLYSTSWSLWYTFRHETLQDKSSKSVPATDRPSGTPCVWRGQAANRKGCAAMTRKTYCGNLLWQSGLTLLAPDNAAQSCYKRTSWAS